jgi:nucleoid-associated protein YgaU
VSSRQRSVPLLVLLPTSVELPAEGAAVRPVERRPVVARSAVPAGRGCASGVRATRRDPVRPGARAPRSAGLAGPRPVRGGCSAEVGVPAVAGVRSVRRQQHPPLRLTDRGRRVVAGLSIAIGLVIAAGTAVTVELGDRDRGLQLAGSSTVVVQSGDTLWSLAQRVAPGEDPRAVVDAIVELNGLYSVDLTPGMELQLP